MVPHTVSTPGHTPLPQGDAGWPKWAHKRAAKLAEVWGPGRVLLAYPRTRALFALPFAMLGVMWSTALSAPLLLLFSGQFSGQRTAVVVGIGLLIFFVLMCTAVTLLAIDSWRTSILATPGGIEVRQFPFRTRRVRWDELHRVEAQQTGYRTGASVLVLATGERIVCKATDVRRAFYNGHRIRTFKSSAGQFFSPTTAELISLHREWMRNVGDRKSRP